MPTRPWSGWENAAIYAAFVQERPLYKALNRELARRADVASARRVLDLACGTGATTGAILPKLAPDAEVVGVDGSREMVEVARAEVRDPRARFVVAAAAAVARRIRGSFDLVLCNAAFWQFPSPGKVLGAVAAKLAPGGVFLFDVPAERVKGEPAPIHPLQAALARAIELRTGRPFAAPSSPLDPKVLAAVAASHGLALEPGERWTYRTDQGELVELFRIPAMIGPLTPGWSAEERNGLLDEVAARVRPGLRVEVPWIFFRAVKERGPDESAVPPPPRP